MELTMTLRVPRRRAAAYAVTVTAGADASAEDVRAALAHQLGMPIGSLVVDGERVPPDTPVGSPPLLHGADIVADGPTRGQPPGGALDVCVVAGPDAGARLPLRGGPVVLGRGNGSDLVIDDPGLSRRHAALRPVGERVEVDDLGSTNGVLVRDVGSIEQPPPLTGAQELSTDSVVQVGSTLLRLRRAGHPSLPCTPDHRGHLVVRPAARVRPTDTPVAVPVPTPPAPRHRARVPWVAAVLPIPFAVVMAFVWGPMMLGFALLGPVMVLGTALGDRVAGRREHARALAAYEIDLARAHERYGQAAAAERRRRDHADPDPAEVLAIATDRATRLWERAPGDDDWGRVRLGRATLPPRVQLSGAHPAPLVPDLPAVLDLTVAPVVGVTGPDGPRAALMRLLLGQLVTARSPAALGVWGSARADLAWHARVPHHRGDPRALLEELDREADAEHTRPPVGAERAPSRRAVALDEGDDRAVVERLLRHAHAGRVWVLVTASTPGDLVAGARALVTVEREGVASVSVVGEPAWPTVQVDGVGAWWAARLAHALAPLVDGTAVDGALPAQVSLPDVQPGVLDAAGVSRAWGAYDGGLRATLGMRVSADGATPWVFDLAAQGPHALVAGTTGAGKSELLQALVLSLAARVPPGALDLVLVDYKGGAAFGACAGLPHVSGLVTDLDGHLAARALRSLEAEVRRRERILATVGASSLDDYLEITRRRPASDSRPGGSLPQLARMLIVVDELRVLVDEVPEFVDGLVRLAAVGRSLGIHLVLATQRPAGVVTADISANVNVRIALRVRDRADSLDVVEAPDAALVSAATPGRGWTRTGGQPLTAVQVAWVGGPVTHEQGLRVTLRPLTPTSAGQADQPAGTGLTRALTGHGDADLPPSGGAADAVSIGGEQVRDEPLVSDAILTAVTEAARAGGHDRARAAWLPPLPEIVPAAGSLVALVDDPEGQARHEQHWPPEDAAWAVTGGPGSGRTGTVLTLAAAATHGRSPEGVHVHAIGGPALAALRALPHTGSIVDASDAPGCRALLDHLGEIVAARRAARAAGAPAPGTSASGTDTAYRVVLLLDEWERFVGATQDADHGELTRLVADLMRSGREVGLSVVVAGGRSVLLGPLAGLASRVLVLRPADPLDALMAGLERAQLPEHWPPGRAVRAEDGAELQVALVEPDDLRRRADQVPPVSTGAPRPWVLRPVPERVEPADLPGVDVAPLALGRGGTDAGVVEVDPDAGRTLLVVGPARSGRTTLLRMLATRLVQAGRPVAVVAAGRGDLARGLPDEVVCVRPDDPADLVAARHRHPDLAVLVDDAEGVEGTASEPVLAEVTRLAERDGGLVVVAADAGWVALQYRGLTVDIARRRHGIVLCPQRPSDGALLGVRLPRLASSQPGRAVYVSGSHSVEVQLASAELGAPLSAGAGEMSTRLAAPGRAGPHRAARTGVAGRGGTGQQGRSVAG